MSRTPLRPLAYQTDDLALHKAIMQAAHQYLRSRNDNRFADKWAIGKMVLLAAFCLTCYGMLLQQHSVIALSGWYLGFIFSAMLLVINVVHDTSHNAFFRSGRVNAVVGRVVSMPLGLDPDCWRVRHVIFHHTHTNIADYDPDIDENGLLRQTPFQRWKPFMRLQHWYWPLIAAFTFPWYIWLVDWLDRAGQTRVTPKMAQRGLRGWAIFLASKCLHFSLALVIPAFVLSAEFSFFTLLIIYLLCQMVSSLLFVMLIVGTHWAKSHFFEPPESGNMPHSWYQHVFTTTFDWQARPAWLGYWLGGANLHLTHHLFPNWHHRHYPALSQLIAEVAGRFNVDYQKISLRELLVLQQQFLKQMGVDPRQPQDATAP